VTVSVTNKRLYIFVAAVFALNMAILALSHATLKTDILGFHVALMVLLGCDAASSRASPRGPAGSAGWPPPPEPFSKVSSFS